MAEEVEARDPKRKAGAGATAGHRQAKPKGRPPKEGLDASDRKAIAALLMHPTQAAAAAAIGVSSKTMQRKFHRREFRDEYFRQVDGLLAEHLSMVTAPRKELWHRFRELAQSENETIALRAVTWYHDYLARLMRSLYLRHNNDDDEGAIPPELRELYEGLEGTGHSGSEDDAA